MPGTWQTRQVPPTSQVGPPRRLHSEPRVYLLKQVFRAHYSQESLATGVGGRRPRDAHLTTQCSVTALTGSPGMPGCGDRHRLSTCSTGPPWCQTRAHSWECWHSARGGGLSLRPRTRPKCHGGHGREAGRAFPVEWALGALGVPAPRELVRTQAPPSTLQACARRGTDTQGLPCHPPGDCRGVVSLLWASVSSSVQ